LVIEDEQVSSGRSRSVGRRFEHLDQAHVEKPPNTSFMASKVAPCRPSSPGLSSADAELPAGRVGKLFDPRFEPDSVVRLRHGMYRRSRYPRRDG